MSAAETILAELEAGLLLAWGVLLQRVRRGDLAAVRLMIELGVDLGALDGRPVEDKARLLRETVDKIARFHGIGGYRN